MRRTARFIEGKLLPKVREVMVSPVVTVSPQTSVMRAVEVMVESRVGSVVVVEDEEPVGIFTRHDLLDRVMKGNRDAEHTRVGEIMSKPLVTVEPNEPITEAVEKMQGLGISRLAVLEKGRLSGIITNTDIRNKFSRGYLSHRLLLKKFAVDTLAYAIFWSAFSYVISVLIVGISWDKYVASSAIGWVVTITMAGPYGRFLDVFRQKMRV